MRPWLPLLGLSFLLLALAASAGPEAAARPLPDVSAAAPPPSEPPAPPAAPAPPEVRVPLVSSAGFEPRAAHGEY